MPQRIDKIEQELVNLESAIALLSQQLLATYAPYLKLLGKAIQRQLIIAVYHLCTDIYPESFLTLSLNQRINLQSKIKQIAQGIRMQLLTPLADLETIIFPPSLDDLAPEKLEPEKLEKVSQVRQLVNWQQQTDVEIVQVLQQGSKEVNNLLHQAGLLAQQFPIALLEAAAKVESLNAAAVISRPNTISLLVDTENNPEVEPESISQIISQNISIRELSKDPLRLTAIYLQIGDLEFNDPELGNITNNLRVLITKLHGLDREYHKQVKFYQVAQAQAAWRSTWTED